MAKKTVLITGATSGIGLAGAEELGRRGWRVLVHGRHEARAREGIRTLTARVPGGQFEPVTGDLASLQSIAGLAEQVKRLAPALDALWNNAGGMVTSYKPSADGVEWQMAVNHLAPFVLTNLLLENLKAAPAARVVATSSWAHTMVKKSPPSWLEPGSKKYSGFGIYGKSKLANVLFTHELAARLKGTRVTAHCFHPGWVATRFAGPREPGVGRSFIEIAGSLLALSPRKGADTGVFLVDEDLPTDETGGYWSRRKKRPVNALVTESNARRLWEESEAYRKWYLLWPETAGHPGKPPKIMVGDHWVL